LQKNNDVDIEKIVKNYHRLIYKIAYTHTNSKDCADDVFQNVFLKYIKKRDNFNNEEHRKAWLIRVTINQSKKMITKACYRKEVLMNNEKIVNIGGIKKQMEDQIIDKEIVYKSILKLPLKYRSVIHLFYYEDMSINQISKVLGKREGTIKSQLNRAKKLLKESLKGDFNYD